MFLLPYSWVRTSWQLPLATSGTDQVSHAKSRCCNWTFPWFPNFLAHLSPMHLLLQTKRSHPYLKVQKEAVLAGFHWVGFKGKPQGNQRFWGNPNFETPPCQYVKRDGQLLMSPRIPSPIPQIRGAFNALPVGFGASLSDHPYQKVGQFFRWSWPAGRPGISSPCPEGSGGKLGRKVALQGSVFLTAFE